MLKALFIWLLSKAAVISFALLLSGAIALAFTAKQQYDAALTAQYDVAALESIIEAKDKAEVVAAKLLRDKASTERKLRHEVDKLKKTVRLEPDDGCLDQPVPSALLDVLRD